MGYTVWASRASNPNTCSPAGWRKPLSGVYATGDAMLTQQELKDLLHYCPETGVFTCLKAIGDRKLGAEVGTSMRSEWYLRTIIGGNFHYMHRLAWLYTHGVWPEDVDHINGIRYDNRLANLRSVSRSTNSKNAKQPSNNTSGTVGVNFDAFTGRWLARVRVDGKSVHLGRFDTKEEAISVRKAAEKKHGYHPNHGRVLDGTEKRSTG